jgi:hypothetical protein
VLSDRHDLLQDVPLVWLNALNLSISPIYQ